MSSNFLEQLASEWYAYKGYFVRQNVHVGKRAKGGYDCELDVVAFNPETKHLVHMEPSMDSDSWVTREKRYSKKFQAGKIHIPALFKGTALPEEIEQIALFEYASNMKHTTVGGGRIKLVKEFLKEIKEDLNGKMINNNAVSEHMPLLRLIQFMCHYHDFIYPKEFGDSGHSLHPFVTAHAKPSSIKKKEAFREFLQTMGLVTFISFYEDFKAGARDKTINLLKQKGYTQSSAQVRWSSARSIFAGNLQVKALEYICTSRVDSAIRAKAAALLLKERN